MNVATFLLLGSIVVAGLAGLFGGYDHRSGIESADAALEISGPSIIRNGEYDEMTIKMTAKRPIENAVLEVDATFWRDMTINTMIPSPEREELRNGIMRFEFGPLDAGDAAQFKIDAQVNPHRFGASEGRFVLLDGDRPLAELARELTVMP